MPYASQCRLNPHRQKGSALQLFAMPGARGQITFREWIVPEGFLDVSGDGAGRHVRHERGEMQVGELKWSPRMKTRSIDPGQKDMESIDCFEAMLLVKPFTLCLKIFTPGPILHRRGWCGRATFQYRRPKKESRFALLEVLGLVDFIARRNGVRCSRLSRLRQCRLVRLTEKPITLSLRLLLSALLSRVGGPNLYNPYVCPFI